MYFSTNTVSEDGDNDENFQNDHEYHYDCFEWLLLFCVKRSYYYDSKYEYKDTQGKKREVHAFW